MAEIAACSLCELPCGGNPLLRTYDGRALPFCCMGCANLHTILLESGVLVSGLLSKVEDAFRLGARTTRVVRQNLSWAFFYNIVGITLALSGVLTPIFAAAAMLLSSTSVVANSMRLIRQEGR